MTKDMTVGSPVKLILFFTFPLLIGNLFQQLYSMADTFIVGRTLGVNALAAVGCTGSLTFFILGFAQGLTSGFSIIMAQRFGARDMEGVRRSFAASILLSAIVTLVLTLVSVLGAKPLLHLLHTPEEIIEDAYRYIVIIFAGIGASMLFNLLSNVLRALGDSKMPLIFLVIACILNIVLDFVLILYADMGVAGAAVATVAAQLVSGLLCVLYIVRSFPMLHLGRQDLHVTGFDMGIHLKMGLPMGFQASIIAIGTLILQFTLNNLGALSVAAYTAAQKVDNIATQPTMSFGMTMATYAGQNYGAGKIDRIRKGVLQCSLISVTFSIVMGLVNIFFGHILAGFFVSGQPEVIEQARIYLAINGSAYFVLALLFIFRYTLQGLGQSFVPTFAGIMELVMRSFAAVILTGMWGYAGACAANPLAWLGSCVPLSIAFFVTMKKLRQNPPAKPAITDAAKKEK